MKLHSTLVNKNQNEFWKTWKSKVSKNPGSKITLENNLSDTEAASKFAEFFKSVFSPNN